MHQVDPFGEAYIFGQMSSLMDVMRCNNLVELPAAITRWEKSLSIYAQKTGGQAIPPEWKLPIPFKLIPNNLLADIKLRHKYTTGDAKLYDGVSRILIELVNERVYDSRAAKVWGANDMDVDPVDADSKHPDYAEKEYTEQEYVDYETKFQEELY